MIDPKFKRLPFTHEDMPRISDDAVRHATRIVVDSSSCHSQDVGDGATGSVGS